MGYVGGCIYVEGHGHGHGVLFLLNNVFCRGQVRVYDLGSREWMQVDQVGWWCKYRNIITSFR